MVKHKPTPTHKSRRPGSRVARACGSTPCSCETDAGCHPKCGCPFKTINKVLSKKPDSYRIDWIHWPLPFYSSASSELHCALVAGHTSIMSPHSRDTGELKRARRVSMKLKQSELSWNKLWVICGQLAQSIRVNKMFSGCLCFSYTFVTCGFIFKLKKKLLSSPHDLEYFAIPFQIKTGAWSLWHLTKNVSKLLDLFTFAPYFGFHAY